MKYTLPIFIYFTQDGLVFMLGIYSHFVRNRVENISLRLSLFKFNNKQIHAEKVRT